MSFISEIYNNAVAAYGLNKLFSTYTGPLVRVVRESDFVEVDVLPDDNFEVSHDSLVIGSADTGAVTLGQFMNIPTYDNPDSLPDVYESRIVTLYDQSAGRRNAVYSGFFTSLLYVKHSSEILFGSGYEILSVNNTPAFYVLSSAKLVSIPNVLDRELSFHMLAASTQTSFNTGLELQEAFATNVIGSIALSPISQSVGILPTNQTDRFDVNAIYINSYNCPETSTNVYTKSDSDNEPYQILTAELKAQNSTYNQNTISASTNYPSFFFLNNNYYSSIVIYDGYNNIRRLDIESYLGGYSVNTTLTKNLLSLAFSVNEPEATDNGFIAQFGTPAAAYSVRDLRGGVNAEGNRVTQLMRVRRDVDNIEVDVYADNSGWISLDSPVVIVPAITGQIDGGTGVEIDSLASTLGEFVADADHEDVDSLGSPTTAKVVVWYDQSSADYTIISEEIDARGAPVRIRVVGGTYDAYEFDLYFDDNDSISLSSYVADTYEISDGATQVTANLTLGTLQTLVDDGMTDATVCVWYDQSSSGNDATQTTTGNQPKIYDSTGGVLLENGKPAIHGTGVVNTLFSTVDYADLHTSNNCSAVQIVAGAGQMGFGGGGSNTFGLHGYWSGLRYFNAPTTNSVSATNSNHTVVFANRNSNTKTLHENATELFSGTDSAAIGTGAFDLTHRWRFASRIQEAIWWADSQSSNRTGIETNVNNHYQIPSFNATASTAQTVAVYNNAINTTVDLNATYTDLKEIIKYE